MSRDRAAAGSRTGRAFVVGFVTGGFLVLLALALRILARPAYLRVLPVTSPVVVVLGLDLDLGCAAVAGLLAERVWPERSTHEPRALGTGLATLGSPLC